jgi:hypothetical protein
MRVVGQIPEDQIREQLAGRSLNDAMDYLLTRVDLEEGSTPGIALSLNLFDRMPILPMRIDVVVQSTEFEDDAS